LIADLPDSDSIPAGTGLQSPSESGSQQAFGRDVAALLEIAYDEGK